MSTYRAYADAKVGKQVALSAATTLIAEDSGTEYLLAAATGFTVTLPPVEAGLYFKFTVNTAFGTDNWIIDSSEGDNINGIIADMGSTVAVVLAGDEDQINFVASAETVGDFIELRPNAALTGWLVNGMCGANGGITATDPS